MEQKNISRRTFLKYFGAGSATLLAACAGKSEQFKAEDEGLNIHKYYCISRENI